MAFNNRPWKKTLGKHEAILLIGPTGSGKSPLGDLLAERSLPPSPLDAARGFGGPGRGRACAHFDFGRELRRVVSSQWGGHSCLPDRTPPLDLTPDELDFVRRALDEGVLLENEHFHVAWKVLTAFIARRIGADKGNSHRPPTAQPQTPNTDHRTPPLVVLNGLPRHIGQAIDVDCIVDVRLVIHLCCTPEVVLERIRTNAGGDRAGRADDDLDSVRRRLADFDQRTKPLIDHYAALGANVIELDVGTGTTPTDCCHALTEVARGKKPDEEPFALWPRSEPDCSRGP